MRSTLALLAALVFAASPATGQRLITFGADPAGTKPDGWSSVSGAEVSFAAPGPAALQLGNFGGFSPHAIGVSGAGSLFIYFTEPAVLLDFVIGGNTGSLYTFTGFLNGGRVGPVETATFQPGTVVRFADFRAGGNPFNAVELTRTVNGEAAPEVVNSFIWYTQADIDRDAAGFNTVPEPASMALLGTGLAGLVAARRRRKREQGGE